MINFLKKRNLLISLLAMLAVVFMTLSGAMYFSAKALSVDTAEDVFSGEATNVAQSEWDLGNNATFANGTYTISHNGSASAITTKKSYKNFILEWKVVDNTAQPFASAASYNRTVRIRSGGTSIAEDGTNIGSTVPVDFYLPTKNSSGAYSVSNPLIVNGKAISGTSGPYAMQNWTGTDYRLIVCGSTFTLYEKIEGATEYTEVFACSNNYLFGKGGNISICVSDGGAYKFKNVVITELEGSDTNWVATSAGISEESYVLAGNNSTITTREEYKNFIMEWSVVENHAKPYSVTAYANRTVRIRSGMTALNVNGENIGASVPVDFYMPTLNADGGYAVSAPLIVNGGTVAGATGSYQMQNWTGTKYRLVVSSGSFELFEKAEGESAYTSVFALENVYLFGKKAKVEISIPDGGMYEIKDLTITELSDEYIISGGVGITENGVSLAAKGAIVTTTKSYSNFSMEWKVAENTVANVDTTTKRSIKISMGKVSVDKNGSALDGEKTLDFYLTTPISTINRFLPNSLAIGDSAQYTTNVRMRNWAGTTFKIEVIGSTLTFYEKQENQTTFTSIFSFTNENIIGTSGPISITTLNDGVYTMENLTFTELFDLGVGVTCKDGVYTLSGSGATITTQNSYKGFDLRWTVVSSTITGESSNGYNRALKISMGGTAYNAVGYYFGNDKDNQGNPKGKRQIDFYMSPEGLSTTSPFQINEVSLIDAGKSYTADNSAGTMFRLLVNDRTLTLYQRKSVTEKWTIVYTFENIYTIGTSGKVSMSIVNSGKYQIKDLSISEFNASSIEKEGSLTVYVDDSGNIYPTQLDGTRAVTLKLATSSGASVRLNSDAGIRFTFGIEKLGFDALGLAENNIKFGAVMGYKENVGEDVDLGDIKTVSVELDKAKSWYRSEIDGVEYRCYNIAITNINVGYYHRQFVARNYAVINFYDGTTVTLYSKNDSRNTLQEVASILIATSSYNTTEEKQTLQGFAGYVDSNAKQMAEETKTAYVFETLGLDRVPIVTYVGPTKYTYIDDSKGSTGIVEEWQNLINDDVFKTIADMGINVIVGHGETEEEIEEFFKYCEKYNMVYLPRYEYTSFVRWSTAKNNLEFFPDFSTEEQTAIINDFTAFLNKYKDRKAFGGIAAGDEPGYMMLPALKAQKEIFDQICSDKLFYINMHMLEAADNKMLAFKYLPFTSQAKAAGLDSSITDYTTVVKNFVTTLKLKVISFDEYMFFKYTNGDRAMSEENLYDNIRRVVAGAGAIPVWFYTFTGYDDNDHRVQHITETYFQMNGPLTAGMTGLEMYPGFEPVELWRGEGNQLYNPLTGKPNEHVAIYKEIYRQIQASQAVLAQSKYKGMVCSAQGTTRYYSRKSEGLLPVSSVSNNGSKPVGTILSSFNQLKSISTSATQIVAGCYNYKGYTALYVFNNAVRPTVATTTATLNLSGVTNAIVIQKAKGTAYTNLNTTNKLQISLSGGEGALVVLGTTTLAV